MTPKDETALFARASELPVAEREDFLTRECAGDPALRQRLDALLAAHEQPDTMLAGRSGTLPPAERISFSPVQAEESVGQRLGRFKLLEKLGEGGCGVVYVAEQTEPVRRRVALKVIKLGMDTKQVIARFEAERQALAMMDHPNIAKVLDAGTTGRGRPYFVMELVRGIPITDYCDQTNLPMAERLDLFIKVCRAIQHAHQKGIIHRDIKPSNILVTLHDGVPVPKVIDFGIAKATEGRLADATVYTQLHQFVGTPAYMSPEQAEMSGLDIDTRSDIYSLGVLLYELLAGRTPFDAKELVSMGLDAMRRTIREAEPVRPSTRLATLSGEDLTTAARRRSADTAKLLNLLKGDLDWIVMKCLEKDRQRRYETANGLAADISRHLSNEPVEARPPTALYKFRKAWRRNQLVFNAGAAVAGAMLLGILLATTQARRARHAMEKAKVASRQAEELQRLAEAEAGRANSAEKSESRLRREAEQQELAARRRAYAADMRLCQQALAVNNLREARQLLDRQRPATGQADLRGWEWRHLWQRCRSGAIDTLAIRDHRVLSAFYFNDGRSVLTYENGGRLSHLDVSTRKEGALLQERESAEPFTLMTSSGYLALSADGEWCAAVGRKPEGDFVARVWDLRRGTLMTELPLGPHRAQSLAFSPDRKSLVTVMTDENVVRIWNLAVNTVTREIPFADENTLKFHGAARYSRDGRWLAIGDGTGTVRLLNTASGSMNSIAVTGHGGITSLAFSPDGRHLAVGRAFVDPNVRVLEVATGKEFRTFSGHRGFITDVTFSPDGALLASASGDQTIKLWDTATGELRATLRGHTDEVWSVDFSADGKNLLSAAKDGRVCVWRVHGRNGRDDSTLLPQPEQTSLDIAPDGRRHVTTKNGIVHLWGATNSIHPELGTNNIATFWVAPNEILLGADNPPRIKSWNLADQTVAVFPLRARDENLSFAYLAASDVMVVAHEQDDDKIAVTRWDAKTRRELSTCAIPGWPKLLRHFFHPASSQDGLAIASLHDQNSVAIYDLTTGAVRSRLEIETGTIHGLALSPDAKWLACARRTSPSIEIWDVADEKLHTSLPGHNLVLLSVEFSADGRRLISSSIGSEPVRLWDTSGWHTVFTFEPTPDTFLWAPHHLTDGNTIGLLDGRFEEGKSWIRTWQAPTMQQIDATEAGERERPPR